MTTVRAPKYAQEGAFTLSGDTSPGGAAPMAAPADCESSQAYLAAIRDRYRHDPAVRQQIAVLAKHVHGGRNHQPIAITGPFADQARDILRKLYRENPR